MNLDENIFEPLTPGNIKNNSKANRVFGNEKPVACKAIFRKKLFDSVCNFGNFVSRIFSPG
jgi:hypothetical protein